MTVFMNCELPGEINSSGWHNWGKIENEKTARYFEYNNVGEGSDTSKRVQWMREMNEVEAKQVTLQNVMGEFYELITCKI